MENTQVAYFLDLSASPDPPTPEWHEKAPGLVSFCPASGDSYRGFVQVCFF